MNKIDELKRDIEFHKRGMEISKSLLANAEKDLAALEAQERKPREIEFSWEDDGSASTSFKLGEFSGYGTAKFREVTPLVITREMAKAALMAIDQHYSTIDDPDCAADVARALGIDAVPEIGSHTLIEQGFRVFSRNTGNPAPPQRAEG